MLENNNKDNRLPLLMMGAIGVIYGDIGTSPLYSFKICFSIGNIPVNEINVLGLTSLFIWSLLLAVTIKYVNFILQTDDDGEGGILVLSSLSTRKKVLKKTGLVMGLGIVGFALLISDGIITPAISVLGALEGLKLISPFFSSHILVLAVIILGGLFYLQRVGSGEIGKLFGPIMVIWFLTLGLLGIYHILSEPIILNAINPYYAIYFFIENQWIAFFTMGGVILVVTGCEAIYADLGHFGRKAIQYTWNFFVLPALSLNYLGQGSLLLHTPKAVENPFYYLVPEYAVYPLIILATVATIIASQAVISGMFSLFSQAIMLNYIPRLRVKHTSAHTYGQIYLPTINILLCILTILAVLIFKESKELGFAYGLAVAGTMLITNFFIILIARKEWEWSYTRLFAFFTPLVILDLTFFSTNLIKIVEGAWFPIIVCICVCYTVWVWLQGNKALIDQKYIPKKKLKEFLINHKKLYPETIPTTSIFLTRYPNRVPNALVIHLQHNKFQHKKMIFLSIIINNTTKVYGPQKYEVDKIFRSVYSVVANFGYMEAPNLQSILNWMKKEKILKEDEEVSFFFSKGIPVISGKKDLTGFAERLYIFLVKNSIPAYEFYKVPHERVVELGVRYRI